MTLIGLDSNCLIAALIKSAPQHNRVTDWLRANEQILACPTSVIAETLRVITHPRVFSRPLILKKAVELVQSFIDTGGVLVLGESDNWWTELLQIADSDLSLRGNHVFDARICLCLRSHGVKHVLSFDSDLDRFPFITRVVP